MKLTKAFTLLEMVFVFIILAILASFALPLLSQNKEDAKLLRAKMDYEMLSASLALMRNEIRLRGGVFTSELDEANFMQERQKLFYCLIQESKECSYSLLKSPLYSSFKTWIKVGQNHYRFFLNSKENIDFIYKSDEGILECVNSKYCKEFL